MALLGKEGFAPDRILFLDGGMGTELERNLKNINLDHLWSARMLEDDPDAIK